MIKITRKGIILSFAKIMYIKAKTKDPKNLIPVIAIKYFENPAVGSLLDLTSNRKERMFIR